MIPLKFIKSILAFTALLCLLNQGFAQKESADENEPTAPPLSIIVSDPEGKGIANAKVVIDDKLLQLTDTNGLCSFRDVSYDEHPLEISARGYQTIESAKIRHDPQTAGAKLHKYSMKVMPVTLAVGVMDRGGILLENAEIILDDQKTKTNEKGVVRFHNVYLDKGIKLTVNKTGFKTSAQKLILAPENWSTEVYQKIILYRMKQFHINTAFQVLDSKEHPSNNGDGKANAGEYIKLPVAVENISDEITASWTLAFRCDSPQLQFTQKSVFENKPLKPGEIKRFLLPAKIRPTVKDPEVLKLVATIIPENDFMGKDQKEFMLPVQPGLPLDFKIVMAPVVDDDNSGKLGQKNNGNNILGAGELARIRVTVGNQGDDVNNVHFYMETLPANLINPNLIKLEGSLKNGLDIKKNQIVDPTFTVDLPGGYDHSMIPFIIMAESGERVWGERFSVPCEGKRDFHATMKTSGTLDRGSLSNLMLDLTYSGGGSFLGNVILIPENDEIKLKPGTFSGRNIASDTTIQLTSILSVPANYASSKFKINLAVQNLELANAPVFKKEFIFRLNRSDK